MPRASLILCLLFAPLGAAAEDEIPPEKERLVRELIEVSGGEQMAGQVSRLILAEVQREYVVMLESELARRDDLGPDEKDALRQRLGSRRRFAEKFNERFRDRVGYDEILERVYIPLYDKYFDEQEIREIVAFYRSPVGEKSLRVMPSLMQEALDRSSEIIAPRAMDLAREILTEERAEFPERREPE